MHAAPLPTDGGGELATIETRIQLLRESIARHESAVKSCRIQIGRELLAVRDFKLIPHGQFLAWAKERFGYERTMVDEFLLFARHVDALEGLEEDVSHRAMAQAVRAARVPHARLQVVPDQAPERDPGERWQAEVGDARRLPLEDNSAGAVICSPPYNARLRYEGYEDWLPWDQWWHGLIVPAIAEAARVLKPGGRLCLNLANVVRKDVGNTDGRWRHDGARADGRGRGLRYRSRGGKKWQPAGRNGGDWAYMMAPLVWGAIEDTGQLLAREQITWVKSEDPEGVVTTSTAWGSWCSPSNPVLRAVAEPVFVADKASHTYEGTVPSDLLPEEFKAWTRNAWFIPNDSGVVARFGLHPAPFPEELPRRLIKLYTWPGDLVVDSFMGLAATGAAALRTGRRFYGCDVSAAYVQRARARLQEVGAR